MKRAPPQEQTTAPSGRSGSNGWAAASDPPRDKELVFENPLFGLTGGENATAESGALLREYLQQFVHARRSGFPFGQHQIDHIARRRQRLAISVPRRPQNQ